MAHSAPVVLLCALLLCGGCSWHSFLPFAEEESGSAVPETQPEVKKEAAAPAKEKEQPAAAPLKEKKEPADSVKEKEEQRPSLIPLISQEGGRYFTEALAQWQEDECLNPAWAIRLLDAVLAECPDYADALIWRGKALCAANYLEDAFDDFTRAIQLLEGSGSDTADRWRARAYAGRALVALRMERQKGAARDLGSAREACDAEATIYLYSAALHFLRDEKHAGCENLDKACELGFCSALEKARSDGLCR